MGELRRREAWPPLVAILATAILVGAAVLGSWAGSTFRGDGLPVPAAGSAGTAVPLLGGVTAACNFYGAPYGPAGAVYDPSTDQVFVADSYTNTVEVIAASSGTIVSSISLGPTCVAAFGEAYDPDLGEVFVAEAAAASVVGISVSNDSVVSTIPVGGGPWNVAYDSGLNELFVTELNQGNISVVSLTAHSVVATVSEARIQQPLGVAYDPSNGAVYVANSLGDYTSTLSVISDASNTITATIPVNCAGAPPATWLENPYGVVLDSRTGDLYVSCEISDGLSIVSTANNSQVGFVPLNGSTTALAVNPSTGEVWAAGPFTGDVYGVSDTSHTLLAQGPTGGYPFEGLAVDTRTGDLYVSNWKSADVAVLSPSASLIATIPIPFTPVVSSLPVAPGTLVALILVGLLAILVGVCAVVIWESTRRTRPLPPAPG
jgi:YVTN family beta-propeller protein